MSVQGKKCPYCQTIIADEEQIVNCGVCGISHHKACWEENRGCTTFGCQGLPAGGLAEQPRYTGQEQVFCPQCGNPNQVRNNYCRCCGAPLVSSAPGAVSQNSAAPVAVNIPDETQDWGKQTRRGQLGDSMQWLPEDDIEVIERRTAEIEDILQNTPKLRRAYDYLAEDSYQKAAQVFDNMLDEDPKDYMAYIGKLLADMRIQNERDLMICPPKDVEDNISFKRACSNAPASVRIILLRYIELARQLPEFIKQAKAYIAACSGYKRASASADFAALIPAFETLADYRQSRRFLEKCITTAEQLKQQEAEKAEEMRLAHENAVREAIAREELHREQLAIENEKRQTAMREKRKRMVKAATLVLSLTGLGVAFVLTTVFFFIPLGQYTVANKNVENGNYDKAIAAYVELEDFLNTEERLKAAYYQKALKQYGEKLFSEAKATVQLIPGYQADKKYTDLILQCDYGMADKAFIDGDYKVASDMFSAIVPYKDSEERYWESAYRNAKSFYSRKEYVDAYIWYSKIPKYKDAKALSEKSYYLHGKQLIIDKDYLGASNVYKQLGDYKDSKSLSTKCYYLHGKQLLSNNDYQGAVRIFSSLGNYSDSKTKLLAAKYGYVIANKSKNDSTTMQYLKELKKAGYKNSASIYASLTKWYVSIVVNTSENDETTDMNTISKYRTVYFHIKVSGGPPSGSVRLRYSTNWPNGSRKSNSWDFDLYDGSTSWASVWYIDPYYGYTGTLSFSVYNKSTGERLAIKTVYIGY